MAKKRLEQKNLQKERGKTENRDNWKQEKLSRQEERALHAEEVKMLQETIKRQTKKSIEDEATMMQQTKDLSALKEKYDDACRDRDIEKTRADIYEKNFNEALKAWALKHEVEIKVVNGQLEIISKKTIQSAESPPAVTPPENANSPTDVIDPKDKVVLFVECVIDIFETAATNNHQTISTNPKGHNKEYTYYINIDCLKRSMDRLLKENGPLIQKYLGPSRGLQIGKICHFIGRVINLKIVNDKHLQKTDILFAFEKYKSKPQTVRSRLSEEPYNAALDDLISTFKDILIQENGK